MLLVLVSFLITNSLLKIRDGLFLLTAYIVTALSILTFLAKTVPYYETIAILELVEYQYIVTKFLLIL